MSEAKRPEKPVAARQAVLPKQREGSAYGTFPQVTTHSLRDPRCFHGKPEDSRRNKARRDFGGKLAKQ